MKTKNLICILILILSQYSMAQTKQINKAGNVSTQISGNGSIVSTKISSNDSKVSVKIKKNDSTNSTRNKEKNKHVSTNVVEYDFLTGLYTKDPKILRQNDPVIFKIININRLFYKPMIDGRDIENNDPNLSDVPTKVLLNKVEEYSFSKPESLNFSSIYSLFENSPKPSDESHSPQNTENNLANINKKMIKSKIEVLKKDSALYANREKLAINEALIHKNNKILDENTFKLKNSQKNNIVEIQYSNILLMQNAELESNNKKYTEENSGLKSQNQELVKAINLAQNKILEQQSDYQMKLSDTESKNVLLGELNSYLNAINTKYNSFYEGAIEIQKIGKRYNNFIDKVNRPDFNCQDYDLMKNYNSANSLEKTTILNPDNIKSYYAKVSAFDDTYNDFLKEFSNPNLKNLIQKLYTIRDLKIYMDFIEKDFTKIKNSVEETYVNANNIKLFNKLNQVEILDRELSQKENFIYTSDPIQGKGDLLEFAVEIKPKNAYTDALAIYQPRKFTYSKNLRGGIRFDFGVGLSIDFKNNNQEYEVVEVQNSKDKLTYLEAISDHKYLPKLVGMFHTSFRNNTNFAFGLSLGTALDVTNFDISSIYLGLSALIGRKDKLVLTIGPSFISAQQLKNTYQQYMFSNEKRETLPSDFQLSNGIYTQNYKIGYFCAITYNLTTKQRSTFMSATQ